MIRAVLTRPLFADLGLLVLRVLTGALLIHHGYEKLANIEIDISSETFDDPAIILSEAAATR